MIETDRLILRAWGADDMVPSAEINRDKEVMEYLSKCFFGEETEQFYNRIVAEHNAFGYGLYAVETKTHIPVRFFTVTVKELPDENFGIGGKSIDEIKRNYKP